MAVWNEVHVHQRFAVYDHHIQTRLENRYACGYHAIRYGCGTDAVNADELTTRAHTVYHSLHTYARSDLLLSVAGIIQKSHLVIIKTCEHRVRSSNTAWHFFRVSALESCLLFMKFFHGSSKHRLNSLVSKLAKDCTFKFTKMKSNWANSL